jgi:hypothetical protein
MGSHLLRTQKDDWLLRSLEITAIALISEVAGIGWKGIGWT